MIKHTDSKRKKKTVSSIVLHWNEGKAEQIKFIPKPVEYVVLMATLIVNSQQPVGTLFLYEEPS